MLKCIFNLGLNILLIFGLNSTSLSQGRYWVLFGENTNPETYQQYKDSIDHYTIAIENESKWFSAVSATLDSANIFFLKQKHFVKEILPVRSFQPSNYDTEPSVQNSYAMQQLNADSLLLLGLNGEGVRIGIIDGGFLGADENEYLNAIVSKGCMKFYKDFIRPEQTSPYEGVRIHQDNHGTTVWQMIAGYNSQTKRRYGMATEADFYLVKTDHGKRESRVEEDYLVAALELMDSLGVRLVNVSLGYTTGFDDPTEDHKPTEVDGKSSMLTKAITKATIEKGMLIVLSAGNEGNDKKWQVLSIPADAEAALSVGATSFSDWRKTNYSSIAPEGLDFVKPDVACFAANGTSFAAPVITGLAACIWQHDSTLSNHEVKKIIVQSAHLYQRPNNYLGYGVPDAAKIKNLLTEDNSIVNTVTELMAESNEIVLTITDHEDDLAVLFHKKDERLVLKQEIVKIKDQQLRIRRKEAAAFTTVSIKEQVYEISWH